MTMKISVWRCTIFLFLISQYYFAASASTAAEGSSAIDLGKRIYREGLNASGQPITAKAYDGIPVEGAQYACASCHKRSGLGSNEGSASVPPITWSILTRAIEPGKRLRHTASDATLAVRPAYSEASLRRAIVDGQSASGSPLSPLMPRYTLSSMETDALYEYLKSLDSTESPGVTADTIHFATVVTGDTPANVRKAMLEVMEAYFRDKNAGTRHEDRRVRFGPWTMENMYKGYRRWELHVWELKGPAESWTRQMEELYRQQPVFAVVNGIGEQNWRPVEAFCEQNSIPCLFPTTSVPPSAEANHYTMYFSRALGLEADTAVKWLQSSAASKLTVQQIFVAGSLGESAAKGLQDRFGKVLPSAELISASLPESQADRLRFWNEAVRKKTQFTLLWLDAKVLDSMPSSALMGGLGQVLLSGTLLREGRVRTKVKWPADTQIVFPYVLPGAQAQALKGLELWHKAKKLTLHEPLIQSNAYLALQIVNEALTHMLTYFSRDYLLETIEHKLGKLPFTGLYPRLSLGPGQRFAAKGCYVLPYAKLSTPDAQRTAIWIVP